MEEIRRSVMDILTCDDNMACAVINKLTELGVSSVADLVEVQVTDLIPEALLPIPARKLDNGRCHPMEQQLLYSQS